MNLKKGDILHCTSNGWLGKAIQFFTRSRINHTALVLEVWNELYIIDSQRDGTNLRKAEDWIKEFNYKYIISRPKNQKDIYLNNISKRALSKSGITPYDFKSLFWYQPVYQITGNWKGKEGPDAEGKMYCSEYVAWVYELKNWWKLSPQDVFDYMYRSKQFDIIN